MSSSALDALDDRGRKEYWASLALRCTKGVSRSMAVRLLRRFGSAYEAVIHARSWSEAGVPPSAVDFFLRQEWRQAARPEWDAARGLDARIVLWTDPFYPSLLRETDDAPALLYACGDLSLLDGPCVALVGSRACSRAALNFAGRVAAELSASGVTVVSGLALGVDAEAHYEALGRPGGTIAVLAGGVDVPYPSSHTSLYRRIRQEGLVISEFPPGVHPQRYMFPVRNRIMSGLSLAVLVAEASSPRSGSILTAHMAAEQGREVCVPSPDAFSGPYPEGTRSLLMEGATPVTSAEEIMLCIMPHLEAALTRRRQKSVTEIRTRGEHAENIPAVRQERCGKVAAVSGAAPASPKSSAATRATPPEENVSCSPDERLLLELLSASVLGADELLCAAQEHDSSWTSARVSSALMMLEVSRRIRRTSDGRYEVYS